MKLILEISCEVVYHDRDGRHIYWPADRRSDVLAEKLREARAKGLDASLAQVADADAWNPVRALPASD